MSKKNELLAKTIFARFDHPNRVYTIELIDLNINLPEIRKACGCLDVGSKLSNILQYIIFEDNQIKSSLHVADLLDYIPTSDTEKKIYDMIFDSIKFSRHKGIISTGFYDSVYIISRCTFDKTDVYNDITGVFDPKKYKNINYAYYILKLPTIMQIESILFPDSDRHIK